MDTYDDGDNEDEDDDDDNDSGGIGEVKKFSFRYVSRIDLN